MNNGQTPLHRAARSGHLDICKILLENIMDKNPITNNGWTPLHYAAKSGHFEVCKIGFTAKSLPTKLL